MKTTKFLFSMMCTAALFASCTSEEFEQEGGATLNRKTLNVTLTAENIAGTSAETRLGAEISGGKMYYTWTEDDRLGAALLDGAVEDKYNTGNTVSVNYPFDFTAGAEDAANFSAKTPIMAGTYMFYYQYKPQTSRKALTLAVEPQQEYVATAGTAANQMAKYYVGVSPVLTLKEGISLENDETNLTLPLKFQKLNAAIKLAITPKDLPEGTKINKIELQKADGIVLGGEYQNPGAGVAVVTTAGLTRNSIPVKNNDNLAEEIEEAAEKINPTTVTDNTVNSAAIAVSMYADADKQVTGERGVALENGKAFEAYIVVPVTAAKADYDVAIYTSEGKFTKEVKDIKFEVGKVYASAFAFELQKKDMSTYGSFDVASTADWDEAVNFVNNHASSYLGEQVKFNIFKGDIYVGELPSFPVSLVSQDAQAELVLGKENKVAVTVNIEKQMTVETGGAGNSLKIKVGKGATVNYKQKMVVNGAGNLTFENDGTLNVQVNEANTITNGGTMEVSAKQTGMNVVNKKGATLTLKGGSEKVIEYKLTALTNNGTLNIEEGAKLDADLTDPTIAAQDPKAVVYVNGEWVNAAAGVTSFAKTKIVVGSTGVFQLKANPANAEIEVSGILQAVTATNDGTITIKTGAKSDAGAITNNGKIVVEDFVNFTATQDMMSKKFNITNTVGVGVTTVNVTTKAQYDAANGGGAAGSVINDITLNGGDWKIAGVGGIALGTKGLTLKGVTATLQAAVDINTVNLKVEGTTTITGAYKLTVLTMKVDEGAQMTVNKGTTIETKADADETQVELTVLGTLINKGIITGGATYGMTINVGVVDNTNHTRHAAVLKNDDTAAELGIVTSGKRAKITNYGTVSFKKGKAYADVDNKDAALFEGNTEPSV